MDAEGPQALGDLCLAQVCHSLNALCSRRADGSMCLSWAPLFPQEVADQLLSKMATKGILNDTTVGIFRNCKELRLRRASIRCCPVSAEAFRLALCPHRLQELDASCISGGLTGANIISSLASNPECRSSLQRLSLNGLCLDCESLGEAGGTRVGFSSLQGLRTLNLANTDLTDTVLEDICTLPLLESLDISCSTVSKLTALLDCKNTLRSLITHRLRQLDMSSARLLFVLSQLQALRHLDFSDDHFTVDDSNGRDGDETVRQLLEGSPQVLPSLVSLDISGRKTITDAAVRAFVDARGGLVFLGLLATGASSCDALSSKKSLKVTGEANENQVCEALRRYRDRECFIREALVHLYNLVTDTDKPRPDMLKLVLRAMQRYPTSLHIHLVATACVFNLTTQDLAEAMPVSLLSSTVTQLLHAMKTFPNHQQVQKNCLLALCSDYILQDVPFDKYLASTLVINWLSSHEDPTLQRMAVAVISILVAKLSTEETAMLGKDIFIMKQLLAIVQQKAMVGVVDSTLKFALSALWNLTDEMPSAARSFIECQGLELYEEVLETYNTEPSIQQKVLGLLNNIAEVEVLQADLMEEDLLEHILSLLQDPQVEMGVRYFAGGILAQLASRPEAWTLDDELHSTILKQLHESIITWTQLEREMVSYRSFRPFCPLLQTNQPSGVQLWAVWAIQLVCSQNTSLYSSLLEKEGVTELLKSLAAHPDTHSDIKELSDSILHLVEQH
ncbi:protein zyg-11 homolog isoform X2 [Micropterus salmoides]|uniref:protein zyg-11 homolog isoform X1 n=1 Tax=Micropterus salmoides TaxID=27706 RepID=UPI0018EC71C9|nr:protein zyg-11 homolog isoform X1 [Micropterus salmoides]XP_038574475.1 protein zyg-11 homolog isoform X2 [Micropterus salmoides]